MNLNADLYVNGNLQSNGYHFQPLQKGSIKARNETLVEMVRAKTVLHLGFSDHKDLIDKKLAKGTWLHALIADSSAFAYGFDTNASAVAHVRNLGFTDVTANRDDVPRRTWDILLMPDVIEHLPNVARELQMIREQFLFNEIVITTPNAFRLRNRCYFRTEVVNSDHRYWFSPFTLARCLSDCGYGDIQLSYTEGSRIRRPLVRQANLLADGLLARATPKQRIV